MPYIGNLLPDTGNLLPEIGNLLPDTGNGLPNSVDLSRNFLLERGNAGDHIAHVFSNNIPDRQIFSREGLGGLSGLLFCDTRGLKGGVNL